MKHANIIKSISAVVAIFAASPIVADTETVNGITWNYTVFNKNYPAGGRAKLYKGRNSASISTSTTGAITVPSSLGGCSVGIIGDYAFYNCNNLTRG